MKEAWTWTMMQIHVALHVTEYESLNVNELPSNHIKSTFDKFCIKNKSSEMTELLTLVTHDSSPDALYRRTISVLRA